MVRCASVLLLTLAAILTLLTTGCSKRKREQPFDYDFIKQIRIPKESGKPYSDYKAFYLLTEDFEPQVDSAADIDRMRKVIAIAADFSNRYSVHWTHFVDANTLAPALIGTDDAAKRECEAMIQDVKQLIKAGDDCELHIHGSLRPQLIELMKSSEGKQKLHLSELKSELPYRQRHSFFYYAFYREGYRQLVQSLVYGKQLLDTTLYDGKPEVRAFRPGGWDHGSTYEDTMIYYSALADAGLEANSGLSEGVFGSLDFSVGNKPGFNLAAVQPEDKRVLEISPTTGPGGYVNPILPQNLEKLATSAPGNEMPVIVSVYHLSALQGSSGGSDESSTGSANIAEETKTLEKHFQTVADLYAKKVLYPVTLRQLLDIIAAAKQ